MLLRKLSKRSEAAATKPDFFDEVVDAGPQTVGSLVWSMAWVEEALAKPQRHTRLSAEWNVKTLEVEQPEETRARTDRSILC
eukprot:2307712-Rhodomonas_salina.1